MMSVTNDKALLYFFFQAKSSVFESVGHDGGHRKSLIPPVAFEVLPFICYYCISQNHWQKNYKMSGKQCFAWLNFLRLWQVKQDLLGISTKMVLKVDIESGKLYIKKSKDGPEDKYFVHNKSKWPHTCVGIHKQCSSGYK